MATFVEKAPTNVAPMSRRTTPRAHAQPHTMGIVDMERITVDRPTWGVRIADYATAQQARTRWSAEPKSWQWLRGLRAAYMAPAGGVTHSVAFGPLSERQATGMCHEARRHSKPCQVVRFGVERQASRGGRDHKA